MIKRYIDAYNFEQMDFKNISYFEYPKNGFVIKLRLKNHPNKNAILADAYGCVRITQRLLKPEDRINLTYYEMSECYFQKTDKTGCAPVVEVEINLFSENHSDWKEMKLGINTLMYDITEKDLYIVYDTVNFRLVYDGVVVNNNLPFGMIDKPAGEAAVNYELVSDIAFSDETGMAKYYRTSETLDKKLNFYTPYGHNTFIGDVVNFYHDGVYHLLYMPDRHHHQNRWGGGGHHFEHMITHDFIDWEDVGPIWDVTEQWQSTGTGTMFFHKGKYYVAYGLHTDRTMPEDKVCNKELREYAEKNGETKIITYDELKERGMYPSGANYSVSDDGVHFVCGEKIFSACENPSIYSDGDKLVMYAGYGDCSAWSAEDVDKPWELLKELKFECFEKAAMRNSSECPSFFEWNGYKYLIMGVTGFWRTEKNSGEYIEYASKGFDVYEGLSVPMAAKTDNNRVILAGWIGGMGWGSMVVHRELVQYENGDLGMMWLPELFPEVSETEIKKNDDGIIEIEEKCPYYFKVEVDPSKSKTAEIRFADGKGDVCELRLDFEKKTAQYAGCRDGETAADILPMYKAIKTVEQTGFGFNIAPDTLPHRCGDFAIAHVRYPKKPFKVRIMIYYFAKNDCAIIDTEIAGTRTMITNRKGFVPKKILVGGNAENIGVYRAKL